MQVCVDYQRIKHNGKSVRLHRVVAEHALGRPLQGTERVHHVDGTKSIYSALVICPDEAYHRLLHRRACILQAGGNPNTDRMCSRCKQPKLKSEFRKSNSPRHSEGLQHYCNACSAHMKREAYARKTGGRV